MATKTLVMGWFSFEQADATAGDLIAKDVVCEWLESAGRTYEVALAAPFDGGVSLDSIDPGDYSHVIFVCGPFFKNNLLRRFERSKLVGVNLSMVEPVEEWNPFDLLLERDSSQISRPDITFLAAGQSPLREPGDGPAIGVVRMDPEEVPADSGHHEAANRAIGRILDSREGASSIDTRLDIPNRSGLRTPKEVEGMIASMDLVLTTRLHGLVLAIKNRVPAVAVDPIPGGGKLIRQAHSIGWPLVFGADAPKSDLERAFDLCLTDEAVAMAERSRKVALDALADTRASFIEAMSAPSSGADWGDGRRRRAWVEAAPDGSRSGWGRRVARRLSAALRCGQR